MHQGDGTARIFASDPRVFTLSLHAEGNYPAKKAISSLDLSLPDGLGHHYQPLAVKAFMDGLAAMAFVPAFRWGVVLSALPVLAWQGTLSLLALAALPWLTQHGLVAPINAIAGLLISFVSLIIFQTMRVEIADYLPAIIVAPALYWLTG